MTEKKISILQPYFFPYIGYFAQIKCVDKWIIADDLQMMRHWWIERNRVLKETGSWNYIKVPLVKYHQKESIREIKVRNNEPWNEKILAQIKHYRKKAPYYYKIERFLKDVFKYEFDSITELNAFTIERTCDYLGINFQYEIMSEMDFKLGEIERPEYWSIRMCKALGYNHFVNGILSKDFYDRQIFTDNGINIKFINVNIQPYDQGGIDFIDRLSIIDVMMWNSPEEIYRMLGDFILE